MPAVAVARARANLGIAIRWGRKRMVKSHPLHGTLYDGILCAMLDADAWLRVAQKRPSRFTRRAHRFMANRNLHLCPVHGRCAGCGATGTRRVR